MKRDIACDSEFREKLNEPTDPICVQLKALGLDPKLLLHPNTKIPIIKRKHPVFQSPCAIIDYFECKWREVDVKKRTKNSITFNIHIFWAYKDIQFLFKDEKYYRESVLPYLERFRRIRVSNLNARNKIPTPWEIYIDGRYRRVILDITDISAMQGTLSLDNYAKNVGIILPSKHHYTSEEKARMDEMYMEDPQKFEEYALGDLELIDIKCNTNDFYNKIADLVGVEHEEEWGYSTGKIVAKILTKWLSKQVDINPEEFYKTTSLAGSKGITALSRILKNRSLIYTGMVDGGRAVRERQPEKPKPNLSEGYEYSEALKEYLTDSVLGVLLDIDIDGCYGNGLRNQKFAVGHPTLIDKPQTLRQFLKTYDSQLIPGLWTARISYKNAPFKQDLLISKVPQAFTAWDYGIELNYETGATKDSDGFYIEDGKNVYDASMVLTTNSITQSALTHDSLQVLKYYASHQEWSWILDNCIVESALIYQKKHRVEQLTDAMREGVTSSDKKDICVKATKEWVEVDLKPFLDILLAERKKHDDKTPMNTFLKLVINTCYGVIASEFFSEENTGVSNVVVGSNITARARTLAWAMAKGLHTYMSITDGGVFDVNKVLEFKQMSLNLLEGLHRDNFKTAQRRDYFVKQVPLMGYELDYEEAEQLRASKDLDRQAWQHLKQIFGKLDIFAFDQFSFKSKHCYSKLTIHSKVDYRLVKPDGKKTIALRGMPRIWLESEGGKVTNPIANKLFDAIEQGEPYVLFIDDKQILSQSDWEKHPRKDELLPHDTVTDPKRFYSHTPLAKRFKDMDDYKETIAAYHVAKASGDPYKVALVGFYDED